MTPAIELTREQLDDLKSLWQIFGNAGEKVTTMNHLLIQLLIVVGEDHLQRLVKDNLAQFDKKGKLWAKTHGLSQDCVDAVCKVLNRPTIKIVTE